MAPCVTKSGVVSSACLVLRRQRQHEQRQRIQIGVGQIDWAASRCPEQFAMDS